MKKILAIFLLLATTNIFSQSLPNNDMEEWEWDIFHLYEQPENWSTANPYTSLLGSISVTKSDDAFSGSHSAKLESLELLNGDVIVPGIITLADFAINLFDSTFTMSGGYFLQENVYKLTGRYKYSGVEGDSASILMYNFKNTVESGFDTIGVGYAFLNNTDEWLPFTVEMQYLNYHVPDTFNVIISSSSLIGAHPGSLLWVDSISIYTNTGIIDLWSPKTPLKVYPNPTTDMINFSADKIETAGILTIYDNFGRKIAEKDFTDKAIKISTSGFTPGVYTYKLHNGNKTLNSGTFIKN